MKRGPSHPTPNGPTPQPSASRIAEVLWRRFLRHNPANPALRWIANYRAEAARNRTADPDPRPLGGFGANSNGIMDMSGNVWEWTDTCHRRVHVDAAGNVVSEQPACTIRVLEGKHRAATSFFIRDAKSGGCSVGLPPDNLGFRLVRRPSWHESLIPRFLPNQ